MIALIYGLLVILTAIAPVYGYFFLPDLMSNLPFQDGMATAQRNNSLVLFGGKNATNTVTDNLYQLTQSSTTYYWQSLAQINKPPANVYGQAVTANNDSIMYLLGGVTLETQDKPLPLQIYQYTFSTNTWTPAKTNMANDSAIVNSTMPYIHRDFGAVYDGESKIYIFGGHNGSTVTANLYAMDTNTQKITALPSSGVARYAHTVSYISNNGLIVIIGGITEVINNGTTELALAKMDKIHVFDTKSNTWSIKNATPTAAGSRLPSARAHHTAAVTANGDIIVFGGDNGAGEISRQYLEAYSILDTRNWTWTVPAITGSPPRRRSFASGGILDGIHFTVAFGSSLTSYYNDVNTLNINEATWIESFNPVSVPEKSKNIGMIISVTIAAIVVVVFLLMLLLAWKNIGNTRSFLKNIHRSIWNPRTGEPAWSEMTRIVFQLFLLFLFLVFLAFLVRQTIDSPNVTQTIQEPTTAVGVPDVRFCFDGYTSYNNRSLAISCNTDSGYSCNEFIKSLDMNVFQPVFSDYLGEVNCFLFRTPDNFSLTSAIGAKNGSKIMFSLFADPAVTTGRVHISSYPRNRDFNVVIYNYTDSESTLISPQELLDWKTNERMDFQSANVFTLQPFTVNSLSYDLAEHQYLQDIGWNYVGIFSVSNSTPQVTTHFSGGTPNPNYNASHSSISSLSLYPNAFVTTVEREVKLYTLLNALGFVGGVFGLLIAVQAWLFGYRPRSPWGVIHRWSAGDMRRSLLRGLRSKFKVTESSSIPLVHPVHRRFSTSDDLNDDNTSLMDESGDQRIDRVENRMQMLEMLFKAYYVNDEVFRSLDDASRNLRANDNNNVSSCGNGRHRPYDLHNGSRSFPTAETSFKNHADLPGTDILLNEGLVVDDDAGKSPIDIFSRPDTEDSSTTSEIFLTEQRQNHQSKANYS